LSLGGKVTFKFERFDVWKLALDYIDLMYEIADKLPSHENYNLKTQLTRAATSILREESAPYEIDEI
jgi:hypothetical protein